MHRNKRVSKYILLSPVILLIIISVGFRPNTKHVALIAKVIQDVTKKSEPADWAKASPGDGLGNGDGVRTGKKSLAVVKFLDNSILRVRENSLLKVTDEGTVKAAGFQQIGGSFGFNIRKQNPNTKFEFTSPTSVASIRGTQGKMSSGESGDTLVVTEGLVNLKNTGSGNDVDVSAGSIGFSNIDGTVSSRKASDAELTDANSAATGGNENGLNFELKDSKGNKKNLKLKYKNK
jgi:hypothetical protein